MDDREADFQVVEYCGLLSCRKPIVQTSGRGRRKEFCSETCRRAADRDYKRARALVDSTERNLRNFRHEVAAYGRQAVGEGSALAIEDEQRVRERAIAALSRARTIVDFAPDPDDRYLRELRSLLAAVEPLLPAEAVRATA